MVDEEGEEVELVAGDRQWEATDETSKQSVVCE